MNSNTHMPITLAFLIIIITTISVQAHAENFLNVELSRVYDGDTIFVNLDKMPHVFGKDIGVRIRGIDTPEIRGKCPEEKQLAYEARDYVITRLKNANSIDLHDVDRDKYFRLLATVIVDGTNLAQILIAQNLAIPYDGGKKSSWCNS